MVGTPAVTTDIEFVVVNDDGTTVIADDSTMLASINSFAVANGETPLAADALLVDRSQAAVVAPGTPTEGSAGTGGTTTPAMMDDDDETMYMVAIVMMFVIIVVLFGCLVKTNSDKSALAANINHMGAAAGGADTDYGGGGGGGYGGGGYDPERGDAESNPSFKQPAPSLGPRRGSNASNASGRSLPRSEPPRSMTPPRPTSSRGGSSVRSQPPPLNALAGPSGGHP